MGEFIDRFGMVYMSHDRGEPSNHVVERDDGHTMETDGSNDFRAFEE